MEHIIRNLNVIIQKQNIKINNLENIINYNKSNMDLCFRLLKDLEKEIEYLKKSKKDNYINY